MVAYKFPHECETEGVARALGRLSGKQQQVLRAFVRVVEFGEKSLEGWLRDGPGNVARSTWYKPDGNYWHDADFRTALEVYRRSYSAWVTTEELKSIEVARRTLRLEAAAAARRMVELSKSADTDSVRLSATKDILNRADESLAEANAPQRLVHELSDEELELIAGGEV